MNSILQGAGLFSLELTGYAVPVFIFVARVVDVTLGTLKMVFVARGLKYWATVLGFFEVLIWLAAIFQILQNLTHVSNYVAFAGGYAVGIFLGLQLEEKMAVGLLSVTIITREDAKELIDQLRKEKWGLTSVSATGATGRVRVIITIIKRKHLEALRRIVETFHPNAFVSIQDVRSVTKNVYPVYPRFMTRSIHPFNWWRKGK